ncbi:reverse transcriptase domain-containing protein, partial [Tanacetum coccineum]
MIPSTECIRTRRSNYPNSNVTIPRHRRRQVSNIVEPEIRTIVAHMAERTMEELLRAPTEGYGEAIVLPEINADHFEIKTNLLQLVQANPFYGRENDNPHAHINSFKRITSTLRFRNVPNDVIKLMMFPYSLEGDAKTWYEKEPPNSILTWEDLVTKFVNQFFPPLKTTHLKNEIFSEAWERFKELLRASPHHGFTELTQVDTFYNGLNDNEQDSLNAAAGGNLLIIEESDSTIPDPSHQTVTSTPPIIAPFTDVSSTKPSSLVTSPPINTEATTSLPEITPFIALHLRVARLEQEMSEVKKTDHSADVLATIKSQVPTASIKNQESEKSTKEIIIIKREQCEEKQDSTYSTRSTDKVDLEEFDLKSALFKHMNKNKTANRNPANYHLYHALMEALIADEDAMDKEVAVKVKDHKRKHDSDD